MTIGEVIKQTRKEKKLTQDKLAKKAGISRSYLADVEGDRYKPSLETVYKLAQALNIDIAYLLPTDMLLPSVHTEKELQFIEESKNYERAVKVVAGDIGIPEELFEEHLATLRKMAEKMNEKKS